MKRIGKRKVLAVFLTLLVVASGVAVAANTNTAVASKHTTTSDFDAAQTLDGWDTSGDNLQVQASSSIFDEEITAQYRFEQNLENEYDTDTLTDGTDSGYSTTAHEGDYSKIFDGSGDYVEGSTDPDNSRTYTVWVNPDNFDSSQDLIAGGWGPDMQSDLTIWYDGTMRFKHFDGSTVTEIDTGETPPTDSWTHYALVYDDGAGELRAYKNGSLVNTKSVGSVAGGDSGEIAFGGSPSGGGDYSHDGQLDDTRLYYDALNDSEVQTVYEGVSGGNLPAEYVSDWHTVENAETASINLSTVTDITVDVTVEDRDGNQLGSGSYTTAGVKNISLSGQTNNDISVNITAHNSTSDSYEVTVESEAITFTNTAPTVDNTTASPTGTINEQQQNFTIDVGDTDFSLAQGDTVNASLYLSGEYRGKDTLTSNGTASVETKVTGSNEYYWAVNDSYGGSTVSDTYNITTPENLYVFQETGNHSLINDTFVNATVTGSDDVTVDLSGDDDGTISLADLPTDVDYVFTLNAEGRYTREVYIDDLFEQSSVYLLNESTPSVQNTIRITDRTGKYGDGTIIVVERVVNTSDVPQIEDEGTKWVTVGGDRLGTSGFYTVHLEQYGRYRFVVRNDAGDERVLGEYTAKADGDVNLQIGTVDYKVTNENEGYAWTTDMKNVTDGNYAVQFAYNDYTKNTSNVSMTIKTRDNGTIVASEDFTDGPYGEVVYSMPVNQSEYENNTYVVEWSAGRGDKVIDAKRLVSGKDTLDFPIDRLWKNAAYGAAVLVLAFLVGAGAGAAPALVTIGVMAGFGVYIGLAPPEAGFGAAVLVLGLGGILVVQRSNQV